MGRKLKQSGINKTAYLYHTKLPQNDPTSFITKHGKELDVAINLYPYWKNIAFSKDKNNSFQIMDTPHFKTIIDRWYNTESDPYDDIVDDFRLCLKAKKNMIKVPWNAYKNTSGFSENEITAFKKKRDIFCGGIGDKAFNATTLSNYRFISISKALHGEFFRVPPIQKCIQCDMGLQAVPLYNIGEGEVFWNKDKNGKRYKVYIYLIAVLCSNYPFCTFPRSRKEFGRYWIKCAWFNDVIGLEQ